ncbi:MAG: hypothetical protein JKY51_05795 [Opitutaceae bacterium]|nr:hypothetical protein [Opitutaceae bacterium]
MKEQYKDQFKTAKAGAFLLGEEIQQIASESFFWDHLKWGCREAYRVVDESTIMANIHYEYKKGA